MKSTLTALLGLFVLFGIMLAWPKYNDRPKTSQKKFVPMSTVHSGDNGQVSEEKTDISPEVLRRLSDAGFKTDGFVAVKTKPRK